MLSDLENNCLWVFHIAGITRVSAGAEEGEILVDDEQPADEKDERWLQIEERLSEEWSLKGWLLVLLYILPNQKANWN